MMRRILAKGVVVCVLCLFVSPRDTMRDAPRPDPVPRISHATARPLPPPSVRLSQRDMHPNAALLLIMTVALRGLHGS
jgi:hypothetical protein